jgi:hypothetical protein
MKTHMMAAAIVLATTTATDASAQSRPRPRLEIRPFSATAAFGETVDVLSHGPTTLRLACRSGTRFDTGEAIDFAVLSVVSSVDDMLVTGARGIKIPAGVTVGDLYTATVPSPDGGWYTAPEGDVPVSGALNHFRGSGGSAITPDRHVLSVPADRLAFGLALYRFSEIPHAWQGAPDCLVTGVAFLSRHRRLLD